MTTRRLVEEAERLSCKDLLDYPIVGNSWKKLLESFNTAVFRGFKPFIFLQGYYGYGKTLMIRKLIAEYAFTRPAIMPIYIGLRKKELFYQAAGIPDIVKASIDYMVKRYEIGVSKEQSECIDDIVVEALRDAREHIDHLWKKSWKVSELPQRLTSFLDELGELVRTKYGLKLAVFVDELEELRQYTTRRLLSTEKIKIIYQLVYGLLGDLYTTTKRSQHITVIASVYTLPELGAVVAKALEEFPGGELGIIIRNLAKSLASILTSPAKDILSKALESGADISNIINEYLNVIRKEQSRGSLVVEPGVASRICTIRIKYTRSDYTELAKIVYGREPSFLPEWVKLLTLLYERYSAPPRYVLEQLQHLMTSSSTTPRLVSNEAIENLKKTIDEIAPERYYVKALIIKNIIDHIGRKGIPLITYTELNTLIEKTLSSIPEKKYKHIKKAVEQKLREMRKKLLASLVLEQEYSELLSKLYHNPKETIAYTIKPKLGLYIIFGDDTKPYPESPEETLEGAARRELEKIIHTRKKH